MRKKLFAVVLTAALAAGIIGCGASANEPQPTVTVEPEAAAEEVEEVEDGGDAASQDNSTQDASAASGKKWVIVTDTAFKPFEYTNEDGDFVGIDVDILDAVAKDQGFDYELQVLGWDASIAACQAGQADGMIAGASITEERKESGWIFSDGYYDADQCLAVAESSDITGFADLKGKELAVKTGTMSAEYAESMVDEYGYNIVYFEDSPTMYQAVVGGQAAGVIDDTPIMAANIKDSGLAMRLVDGTGNDPAEYGLAVFNPDNQELVDLFNAGLKNIKENGTYDEILAKYLG